MLDFIKKLVKKINKLDDFINLYKENAGEVSMPSYAYMNWGIKLLDSGDEKKALSCFGGCGKRCSLPDVLLLYPAHPASDHSFFYG